MEALKISGIGFLIGAAFGIGICLFGWIVVSFADLSLAEPNWHFVRFIVGACACLAGFVVLLTELVDE